MTSLVTHSRGGMAMARPVLPDLTLPAPPALALGCTPLPPPQRPALLEGVAAGPCRGNRSCRVGFQATPLAMNNAAG